MWLSKFELQCTRAAIVDPAPKKAEFLLSLGDEAYGIYNSKKKANDSDTLAAIIEFLTADFTVKQSEYTEIHLFRQAYRHEGETVNDYALRLRGLANNCAYGASTEKEIERQFVFGCRMPEVQAKCMRTVEDLDLKKVLAIAIGFESNISNLSKIQSQYDKTGFRENTIHYTSSTPANKVFSANRPSAYRNQNQNSHRNTTSSGGSCGYCGRGAHSDRAKCPARNAECKACGKMNHFARVCKSKEQTPSRQQSNTSGQHHASSQQASRVNLRHISRGPGSESNTASNQMAQHYASDHNSRFEVDREEFDEFIRYKESCRHGLYMITRKRMAINALKGDDGPRVDVCIQGAIVSCLVDTGSPVDVIDEETFDRLAIKPKLEPCIDSFYGFASDSPIPISGKFTASVQVNGVSAQTEFIVVKGRKERLISYKTALQLKVIKMLNSITSESTRDDVLVEKFPKLFSDKLGCMTGVEVKLDIDKSVKPCRQPQRPIAFHLRDSVEAELLKQVEEGILERVDHTSGPTPWVSNLVIVPKDRAIRNAKGGVTKPAGDPKDPPATFPIRLTCDSRAMNKAVRRTRYPSKTVEDLICIVNGAKVFSKLDIAKAFHQLMLALECRNATTITTHIGLFRYARLHMGISCASEIFTEEVRLMLADLPGQVNMIDDILVFGRDEAEHQKNLLAVLERLESRGITLNKGKCQFTAKS